MLVSLYYQFTRGDSLPVSIQSVLHELPYNKQIQLSKLVSTQDRYLSLCGLQLLKTGMLDLGFDGFSLSTLKFSTNSKPTCPQAVDFSISHSGKLAICAIIHTGKIGIDVEQRNNNHDLFSWTLREATIKAHGKSGIELLDEIRIQDNYTYFADKEWYPKMLDINPGYVAHLVTDQQNIDITYYQQY